MSTLGGKVGQFLGQMTDAQLRNYLTTHAHINVPTDAIQLAAQDMDPERYHILKKSYRTLPLPTTDYSLNQLLLNAAIRDDLEAVDQLIELGAADIIGVLMQLAVRPGTPIRAFERLLEVERGVPVGRAIAVPYRGMPAKVGECSYCWLLATLARDSGNDQLYQWLTSKGVVAKLPLDRRIQQSNNTLTQLQQLRRLDDRHLAPFKQTLKESLPLFVANPSLAAEVINTVVPGVIVAPDYLRDYPAIVIELFTRDQLDNDTAAIELAVKYDHLPLIEEALTTMSGQHAVALAAAKYGKLELLLSIKREDHKQLLIAALSNGRLLTADMLMVPLTKEEYAQILITAAIHGHLGVVRLLAQAHTSADAGALASDEQLHGESDRSVYLITRKKAAEANMQLVVRYLDELAPPVEGESIFLQAVKDGYIQLAREYANVEELPTAIELVAMTGDVKMMSELPAVIPLLVKRGPSNTPELLVTARTYLHHGLAVAAEYGHLPLVDWLLDQAADLDAAIELATANGWSNAVTILSIEKEKKHILPWASSRISTAPGP